MEFLDKFRSSAIKLLNQKDSPNAGLGLTPPPNLAKRLNSVLSKIRELLEDSQLVKSYFIDKEYALITVAEKIDEQLEQDTLSDKKTNEKLDEANIVLNELNRKWPHSHLDVDISEARKQVTSWEVM